MYRKINIFDRINYVIMVLLCITILYPFVNVVSLSFTDPQIADSVGFILFPVGFTLRSYKIILVQSEIYTGYFNTIFRTVTGTFLSTTLMAFTAYPLSKKSMPFRNFFTTFIIITMFFSGGLIPYFLLIRDIGLMNNRWVYVIPGLISAWSLLIVRNYYMALPVEMEESARIDGANDITIILKLIIPLSVPVLATVALWGAVGHWNSWFDSMIFISDIKKQVVQVYLRRLISDSNFAELQKVVSASEAAGIKPSPTTLKSAALIIVMLPILCVYPFLQKYFVKGIMIGSLKG